MTLERLSTYAQKKKFAKEKLPINLKDVPSNYINIISGLGEATPSQIYITALIVKDEVFDVFEITSFGYFKDHH